MYMENKKVLNVVYFTLIFREKRILSSILTHQKMQ